MLQFEKISQAVQKGDLAGIADMVQAALDDGESPQEIIDQGLIAGMDVVGVRFKNDEMYIPEVLVSAKTMHNGVDVLKPLLAMSALLTTTMPEMGVVIKALKEADLSNDIKIIIGGAPVTAQYAVSIGADGYAPDAGSAVDKLKELIV